MKKSIVAILLAALLCIGVASAFALTVDEVWPKGTTVTIDVPAKAGGGTDICTRYLTQALSEVVPGVNFIVNNYDTTEVGREHLKNAKPDGKTFIVHHGGAQIEYMSGSSNVSPKDDYRTVGILNMGGPQCIIASPKAPFKNMTEVCEYAKANPGALRYSTVFGSTTEYVGKRLETLAGIQFDNIDVGTSTGDRLAALLGGQVELCANNYMNVADYIEAGDLVCLGIMAEERVDGIDFPTFKEQGYDVVNAKKYEVKFPKGTDQAIVDKLSALCKEVTEDPEFAEVLKKYYAEPFYRDAATMNVEDPQEVEDLKANLAQ